jgi:hypothetical protein
MKPWWKSKTLWLAIIQILAGLLGGGTGTTDTPTSAALVTSGVLHGLNRFGTKGPIV